MQINKLGGIIAIQAALARPDLVTHLVLAETSGEVDTNGIGAQDWRPSIRQDYPTLPDWFLNYEEDLTPRLRDLHIPALLLWGDADPVSPVKIGEALAANLPRSNLHVIAGADHALAYTHAGEVATFIDCHLLSTGVE